MKLSKVVPSALLRLLLILSILLEESLQSTNCPIDSAHCNCMPNEASFVIWCPSTVNHNFQITIKPRILGISCNANKELRPIDELYFQHCTIPNFSFSAITSALSISSVKEMHLLYNTFEEGQMFIEGQFSGVSSDLERIEIKTPSFKGSNRNVISPNMFDGVREAVTMDIKWRCQVFAKGSLSLKELDIQWNRKYDMIVQDDFLEGCKGLEKISIHKTGLRALPQNIFRNARKLKFLDLSGNAMEDTSELLFIGLTNLQKLSLHTNKLTKVTNKLFSDQRSLISLDLSNNQINNIQDFAFHFMSRLQKLNLRNNVLEFKESEPNWNLYPN
ncbi:unnamed protein product [Lepeophtheirus salmonis]|uniref:(salmon louse) hypothetical protein n=1 Tax=Lepeophtheirus salmonis TaxID=72036 RepID=A0A7R8CBT7_LEPSM|nr:unnamed protein product [Lepeophtheirus salmonis]CAF2756357.1 unnamed protein product [Lepeophtheirus salmonis]